MLIGGAAFYSMRSNQRVPPVAVLKESPVAVSKDGAATPTTTPEVSVTAEAAKYALDLRSYIGRVPDKAFWVKFGGVFNSNLLPSGNQWSIGFESFLGGLDQYVFMPCQYDAATNTVTVTWRSVSNIEEGDIGALPHIGAVSLDVNGLGTGISASLDGKGDTRLSFYLADGKTMSAQDASYITKGNFVVLPHPLAEWASALVKESEKPFEISVM
jgi:hypothetical protein